MVKYQTYKPSGIEWIGDIPEKWILSKIKYVSSIFGRIGYRGYTVEDIVEEGCGVITISPSNIKNDFFTIEGENTFLSFEKYNESPEIQIFPNDIILVKTGSTIGKTSIIPNYVPEMTINPQLVVLKDIKIVHKYLYFQTVCNYFKKSFLTEQTGSSTPTISQEKINNFPILIPSYNEQNQIVQFLDSKTELIDKLISTKERKITLLKEQRTSIINQVVTKGLNPNVKMKDSGVEWIGEIPEHWIQSKVKYVSSIFGRIGYRGYTVDDIVNEGEGVITISPSNIQNDLFTISGENTYISYEKYEESPEIKIYPNDIILVKTGSTIGKTSIIPDGVPDMTINPQIVVLKNIKIDNRYFYFQTVCEYFKKSFFIEQTGSTTPTISQEKINNFPILIPSNQEQLQIVEYLYSKTIEIDEMVQLEQKKIDLLKEYRQSLISEVVTGKIKVTN